MWRSGTSLLLGASAARPWLPAAERAGPVPESPAFTHDGFVCRLFAAPQDGLALSRGRRGSAGRSCCAWGRCQQSWWVLVVAGSVVMGELAAWAAAAWKG